MKHKPDKAAIMRESARLMRERHLSRSDAMKAAWANARAPQQQAGGVKAALKRYGIDTETLALMAKQAVETVISSLGEMRKPSLLPPPSVRMLDLKRGADGVYRIQP